MKRLLVRTLLLVVVPLAVLVTAGYVYFTGGRYVITENAYIKSRLVNISSDIDGRVIQVFVEDSQAVKAGDPLFQTDPREGEIELAAAEAELQNVRLRIRSLQSRYEQSLLAIDDARERIRFLESQLARQQKLKDQGHGLETDYDRANHELEMGRRALKSAHQGSAILLAELGGDPDDPIENHALYLQAKARIDRARRILDLTRVSSPVDGHLTRMTLEPGEYVEAGDLLFAIVESAEVWVEANLKESQLTHLAPGQPATIVVDAYPDVSWQARVRHLSPTTGAETALLPPQNATGNWVKVVQRVPVRLDFLSTHSDMPLRAGMTTRVSVDTGHQREIPPILQPVFAGIERLR